MKRSEKESMNVNLSFGSEERLRLELRNSKGQLVQMFWHSGSVLILRNPSGWPEMMPGASPDALNVQPRPMQNIY